MAKKLYEESSVQAIAAAIREKNGAVTKYKVAEMTDAVRAPSGNLNKRQASNAVYTCT